MNARGETRDKQLIDLMKKHFNQANVKPGMEWKTLFKEMEQLALDAGIPKSTTKHCMGIFKKCLMFKVSWQVAKNTHITELMSSQKKGE